MRLLMVLLAGCDAGAALFATAPWKAEESAVLLVTDQEGRPLEPSPLLLERGAATRLHLEIEAPLRLVVQAYTLTATEAADLKRCGPTLSGDGAPLPAPTSRWSSALFESELPREIALSEDLASPPIDVRSKCRSAPPDLCEGIDVTIIPLDEENMRVRDFDELAFVGESQVVLREHRSQTSSGGLFRIDLEGRIETPLSAGAPVAIAADHRSAFFAAYADGRVARWFADGREDFAVQLPCALEGVTAARDGAIVWGSTCAHAFWGTSSVATPLVDFPAEPKDVLLVSDRRIAAFADRSLHVFDGASWRSERDGVQADVRLAGNQRRFAAAGAAHVLLRDEATREWSDLPIPEFPGSILALAVSPAGRPLVVGQNGLSHFWSDGSWCLVPASVGWNLDIDVSDDGTRAAALSGNQGRYAIVLFDLAAR